MEWIPLNSYENGINLNDAPRRLTQEEIAYITAHLPLAASADSTAAEVARQGIIEWMVDTLKELSMCPSAIPELIDYIIDQHNKSLAIPGTPVGITSAEAVGASTTQMTLNTFHTSGSSRSASFGIDAMRDLIFARKTPKNESCTIYYTNKKATYEEILNSRRYIVGSVVSDFIKREGNVDAYDIDSPTVLSRYWWHDAAELLLGKKIPDSSKVLRLFLNVPEMFKHRVGIKDLADVLEREIPPSVVAVYGPISDGIIDLYPHPDIITNTLKKGEKGAIPPELTEITYLETIVMPELKNIRVKGISNIRQLFPIVSPVWRVVLLERKLTDADVTNQQARQMLDPVIKDESGWLLFYNPSMMNTTGLKPENLAALCELADIRVVGGRSLYLVVSLPDDRYRNGRGEIVSKIGANMYVQFPLNDVLKTDTDIYREIPEAFITATTGGWTEEIDDKIMVDLSPDTVIRINEKYYRKIPQGAIIEGEAYAYELITDKRIKFTELKPSEYVADKISKDKRKRRDDIKRLTDEVLIRAQALPEPERKALIRKPIVVPRTPLMEAAEFVIAETEGSNLKELLALPGIDKTRTTCNNMYTLTSTFGIENARTFLIRALNNTIANTGSYVHPANIMLIAEFITSRGEPYGATYTGISRQPGGHLSLATLERAGKVFTGTALHGRKEDIRNVSASIAVGARVAVGDGLFDIAQDIIENGVKKTIVNDDLFTALSRDDVTQELTRQRNAVAAQEPVEMISPEDLMGGIDMLKTITVGGTFDYTGAEDEANLITLFGPGETVANVNVETGQTGVAPVRRQARVIQPKTSPAEVPKELVDVLTQIKVGVPLPEGTEKITITPLITGVAPEVEPIQPIISDGLVPLSELIPEPVDTGIPTGLDQLLARYNRETQNEDKTVVVNLPEVQIPQLPDLEGVDLTRAMTEMRREQVRDLKPIDTEAVKEALTRQ